MTTTKVKSGATIDIVNFHELYQNQTKSKNLFEIFLNLCKNKEEDTRTAILDILGISKEDGFDAWLDITKGKSYAKMQHTDCYIYFEIPIVIEIDNSNISRNEKINGTILNGEMIYFKVKFYAD